jgi:hypothetical protein
MRRNAVWRGSRWCLLLALKPRFAEERFDGFGVRVCGRGTHAGKRQMRKAMRERVDHATHLLLLTWIEILQLFGERAIGFSRRDSLERRSQLGKLRTDRTRCELLAQAIEAVVDRGAHRRETQQLREAPVLRGLDHFVHADAGEPGLFRSERIDVRGQSEIDDQ